MIFLKQLKFWQVASFYLIVPSFLLVFQNQGGYAPGLSEVLMRFLYMMPAVAVFVALKVVSEKKPAQKIIERINTPFFLFVALMLLVVTGWASGAEYHQQIGCFYKSPSAFSHISWIISGSSIALITIGFLFSKHYLGMVLLLMEFLLCSFKAVYFNISFIYPGGATIIVSSWFLRISFISKLLK